jgi:hypothetical protein
MGKGHGFACRGKKHPVYLAWQNMMTRCYNPARAQWKDYGGRGLRVHRPWQKVVTFIRDMLPSWKAGLTLDRRDNDKNYSKANCRWITKAEQQRNKRNSVRIATPEGPMCVYQAGAKYGVVAPTAVAYRVKAGWSHHDALFKPKHPGRIGRPAAARKTNKQRRTK